jgi:predicted MarR family transcription regulator
MAIPNKLGLPLRTVSTALGRLVTTTIATRGPGLTRIVSAIEEEVLDATVQRIVEEADKFPEDVHIARIEYENSNRILTLGTNGILYSAGWHASVEDRNLQATIALINKSGRVLNKVHIAKNAEQQEPLRLRRVCLSPTLCAESY